MLNFYLKWEILYIRGKIYDFGLHRQTDRYIWGGVKTDPRIKQAPSQPTNEKLGT